MSSNLALKIKTLLDEKHLSVMGVEKKAGLTIHSVRNILTGHSKKPSAETVMAIAKVLDCSISDLMGEDLRDKNARDILQEVEFSNLDLFKESISYFISFYENHNISITNKNFLHSLQNIYRYSMENNDGAFDEKFAKWFLTRSLDV